MFEMLNNNIFIFSFVGGTIAFYVLMRKFRREPRTHYHEEAEAILQSEQNQVKGRFE